MISFKIDLWVLAGVVFVVYFVFATNYIVKKESKWRQISDIPPLLWPAALVWGVFNILFEVVFLALEKWKIILIVLSGTIIYYFLF